MQNVNGILAERLGGKYLAVSYKELIKPERTETRTAEEIIENMKEKLRKIGAE